MSQVAFPGQQPAVEAPVKNARCPSCGDSGHIALSAVTAPRQVKDFAWTLFFTAMPCPNCDYGRSFVKTFEEGRADYAPLWQAAGGVL